MEIKIKKAKLARGGVVETSYIDADGNEITLKGKNKCHNDLRVAFSRLTPYFSDLTEQKESDDIEWEDLESTFNIELLRRLEVTGISIGGDDTNRIITMTGKRTLITSRVLNLNAPGVEMDSESFDWKHIDNFDLAVQEVIFEVKEYILNRKWEVAQREISFENNPDDPFAEAGVPDEAPPVDAPFENVA